MINVQKIYLMFFFIFKCFVVILKYLQFLNIILKCITIIKGVNWLKENIHAIKFQKYRFIKFRHMNMNAYATSKSVNMIKVQNVKVSDTKDKFRTESTR